MHTYYIQQPAKYRLEYVRPRDRVYAVSALRNRTFQLHNSRIGSCPGLLSVCEGVASRGASLCRRSVGDRNMHGAFQLPVEIIALLPVHTLPCMQLAR